jgi:hypothetical protein
VSIVHELGIRPEGYRLLTDTDPHRVVAEALKNRDATAAKRAASATPAPTPTPASNRRALVRPARPDCITDGAHPRCTSPRP